MRVCSNNLAIRTSGEELWLARKAAGITSAEAALRAGVGKNRYAEAELDRNPGPTPFKTGLRRVSRPSLALLLALARRRSGAGLDKIARWGSVSRPTVLVKERAGDPGLKAFWEKRGFRFP